MESDVIKIGFEPRKVISHSKSALFSALILCATLVYFFSVTETSDEIYQKIHTFFIVSVVFGVALMTYLKMFSSFISISIIYISYIIINNMRYAYGEDYIFSAGYNIWIMLIIPNLLLTNCFVSSKIIKKYWSLFFIFIFLETSIMEKLQNQSIDADSLYFYKHIGGTNYPFLCISAISILYLLISYISKGKILLAKTLFSSISIALAVYFSDKLLAYSLFFWGSVLIECVISLYYIFYVKYKDEELDIANCNQYIYDAKKKYPLKYCLVLMKIDEYERLLKRFGHHKTILLKKMFVNRIIKNNPDVKIYNYQKDSLIMTFMNVNVNECFNIAEEIRRSIAKSIFIFNENNHLQLTVSQSVSEKKRSDTDAYSVLQRAENSLQKACKFTGNISVKA